MTTVTIPSGYKSEDEWLDYWESGAYMEHDPDPEDDLSPEDEPGRMCPICDDELVCCNGETDESCADCYMTYLTRD
tara:strand:+ start:581 stop:808 length:228 start_codon:yes stop_codon:yes gene_type:complete